MAISSTLKAFLDQQHVSYKSLKHPAVYTAQEIAAAQHVPGKQLAKCVAVNTEQGLALAVLPAVHRVDFAKLKTLLGAKKVSLASEADIKRAFPDVEVGAMSPFGNLYHVPTVVDESLSSSPEIVCNAGTHTETIKLSYGDLERLATPRVGSFALEAPKPKGKSRAARRPSKRSTKTRAPASARRKTSSKSAPKRPRR